MEKKLRYHYVKGVEELGGKLEFGYLEVMANARSLAIRREQKKKLEEKERETKWKQEVERRRTEQKEYDSRGTLGKAIFQVGKFFKGDSTWNNRYSTINNEYKK
ncbi:conserved hypothetical protein [delta proteobacterium NaphS2]|nr:conserved hypothetical protein [delta proteobacterium NaphS2]